MPNSSSNRFDSPLESMREAGVPLDTQSVSHIVQAMNNSFNKVDITGMANATNDLVKQHILPATELLGDNRANR